MKSLGAKYFDADGNPVAGWRLAALLEEVLH